jgi:hypothetical protein
MYPEDSKAVFEISGYRKSCWHGPKTSLAGRIAYVELAGFDLGEVRPAHAPSGRLPQPGHPRSSLQFWSSST